MWILARLVIVVGLLLSICLRCMGQSTLPSRSGPSTVVQPPIPPGTELVKPEQAKKGPHLYPLVRAYYVGGTIPELAQKDGPLKGIPWYSQAAGLQVNQYRIPGWLTPEADYLVFVFRWKATVKPITGPRLPGPPEPIDPEAPYQVLNCQQDIKNDQPKAYPDADAACDDAVEKKIGTFAQLYIIQVPYNKVNVFARAQSPKSDQALTTTAFAAFTASTVSTLFNLKSHNNVAYGSGGLAVLGLVYFLDFVRAAQTSNYLAVFSNNEKQGCEERGSQPDPPESRGMRSDEMRLADGVSAASGPSSAEPADESRAQFRRADVIMFRIKNYHDYFNISLILSGKTGCTPVSETPEVPPK